MSETEQQTSDASSLVSRVCEELIRAIQAPLSPSELAGLEHGLQQTASELGLSLPVAHNSCISTQTSSAPRDSVTGVERQYSQARIAQQRLRGQKDLCGRSHPLA